MFSLGVLFYGSCRLKEIAESNKDHESALRFHTNEMRAKSCTLIGIGVSVLDALFDFTSNYGQSVAKPFLWLFFSILSLTLYTVVISHIPQIR